MDEILVGQENAEFVGQAEKWRPLGKAAGAIRAVSVGTSGIGAGRSISHWALHPGIRQQNPFVSARLLPNNGVGSGFFVNDAGDILTNYHVVAGAGGSSVASRITIRVINQDKAVEAQVIPR